MSMLRAAALALTLLLAACVQPSQHVVSTAAVPAPPLILISIDGMRPDYLARGVTPNLESLAQGGVRATMTPSFPTLTFPNHYTLVTGLRPDRNGIVFNNMEDAKIPGQKFGLSNKAALADSRWWDQAEPVWVTAEKAGIQSATMYWPGSEAAIHGVRPTAWMPFDAKVSANQRVDFVLGWLSGPAANRPGFVTLYFDDVDHTSHQTGITSPQTTDAIASTDAAIGRLLGGLAARGITANLVIVSDHGMAASGPDKVIRLADLVAPDSVRINATGPVVGFDPLPGREAAVAKALFTKREHVECWRKHDLPARFHFGHNARVPAFICLVDPGWTILTGTQTALLGNHGYDPQAPDMRALFIANGPAFAVGRTLPVFDNVNLYPLLMKLLGLKPLASDGSLKPVAAALK